MERYICTRCGATIAEMARHQHDLHCSALKASDRVRSKRAIAPFTHGHKQAPHNKKRP